MRIAGKQIAIGKDPFVIAEIGVNYDNDMGYAEELIASAKRTGADAAKFQTYTPSKIVALDSPKYWEDEKPNETQYEFFERSNTFYLRETEELAKMCHDHDIPFLSTPFDLESVEFLDRLGVPAFKIASADITNFPLLRAIARCRKPVLLSTGASSIGEIEKATRVIESEGNSEIVLLHCILAYPTPPEEANLQMIRCLRDVFPQYEVGWSDHVIPTECAIVPTVAAAIGATVIEKHYTTDRTRKGNDHFHSADEETMSTLISNLHTVSQSLGQYLKRPLDVEEEARKNARRSIAAKQPIKAGEKFTEEKLIMLRPGTGIPPEFLDRIIGLTAKVDVPQGHLLSWEVVLGSD